MSAAPVSPAATGRDRPVSAAPVSPASDRPVSGPPAARLRLEYLPAPVDPPGADERSDAPPASGRRPLAEPPPASGAHPAPPPRYPGPDTRDRPVDQRRGEEPGPDRRRVGDPLAGTPPTDRRPASPDRSPSAGAAAPRRSPGRAPSDRPPQRPYSPERLAPTADARPSVAPPPTWQAPPPPATRPDPTPADPTPAVRLRLRRPRSHRRRRSRRCSRRPPVRRAATYPRRPRKSRWRPFTSRTTSRAPAGRKRGSAPLSPPSPTRPSRRRTSSRSARSTTSRRPATPTSPRHRSHRTRRRRRRRPTPTSTWPTSTPAGRHQTTHSTRSPRRPPTRSPVPLGSGRTTWTTTHSPLSTRERWTATSPSPAHLPSRCPSSGPKPPTSEPFAASPSEDTDPVEHDPTDELAPHDEPADALDDPSASPADGSRVDEWRGDAALHVTASGRREHAGLRTAGLGTARSRRSPHRPPRSRRSPLLRHRRYRPHPRHPSPRHQRPRQRPSPRHQHPPQPRLRAASTHRSARLRAASAASSPGVRTTRLSAAVLRSARLRATRAGTAVLRSTGLRTARRPRSSARLRAASRRARLRATGLDTTARRGARLRAAGVGGADVRATRLGRTRPEERLGRGERAGVRATRRRTAGGDPPVAGRPGRPGAGAGRVPVAVGPGHPARGADGAGRAAGHPAAADREAGLGGRQPCPGPAAQPAGGGLADARRPGRRAGRRSARPDLRRGDRRAAPDRAGPGPAGPRAALARRLRRGRPALRPGQLGRAARPAAGRAARARRAVAVTTRAATWRPASTSRRRSTCAAPATPNCSTGSGWPSTRSPSGPRRTASGRTPGVGTRCSTATDPRCRDRRRRPLWGYADAGRRLVVARPVRRGAAVPRRGGLGPPAGHRPLGADRPARYDWSIPPSFRAAQPFSDGLAWVSRGDGRLAAIDATGAVQVAPDFDDVRPFRRGVAAVRREGLGRGRPDRSDRRADPLPRRSPPSWPTAGTSTVSPTRGWPWSTLAGRKGVVDRTGTVLVPPAHPALVIHPVAFLVGDDDGRWGALGPARRAAHRPGAPRAAPRCWTRSTGCSPTPTRCSESPVAGADPLG